ncbi:MAG: flagellar biosynthesis protein FlhB [Pseudomonadales bacterium]|nr:flagellar biosynthesis protein FlhB [Pseudomonadales bacterium]
MAEGEDGSDKSEEPTQKKLEDARKKGQVSRSKELSTMLVTLTAGVMFLSTGETMISAFVHDMSSALSLSREQVMDTRFMISNLVNQLYSGFMTISWFMFACLVAVFVANLAVGGWSFSFEAMSPKLEKLNPIKGLGKLFGMRSLVELLKAFLKFILVASIVVTVLNNEFETILNMGRGSLFDALVDGGYLIIMSFILMSGGLVLIAAIDVPFQLYQQQKQLKMTKQEVKDEHKNAEGKPEVKAKIREMQQRFSNQRMMEKVPEADVIITNPTHYAVALQYKQGEMEVPVVIAKGADEIALRIREIAEEHNVILMQSPQLARALYATTEVNMEVPGGLYKAVAQVLAWVYQLKHWNRYGGDFPQQPDPDFDKKLFDY